MSTPRIKYMSDPQYSALVNTMLNYIEAAHYTPSEVREAAVLACILYEERRVSSFVIPKHIDEALEKIHKYVDEKNFGSESGEKQKGVDKEICLKILERSFMHDL